MYNDTLGGPSIYEYAPEGVLVRKTFTSVGWHEDSHDLRVRSRASPLRSVRHAGDGPKANLFMSMIRAGRMILRTQMSAGTVVSTESFQYDGQGRLQREIMQNVDNWLTGIVIYESDSRGRLQRGHFRGYGAIAADLTFIYDDDECLREVRWQFSSGTVQCYAYTYERRSGR